MAFWTVLPQLVRGLAGYATRLGAKKVATRYGLPALAEEAGTKVIAQTTGIPEQQLDTIAYINPSRKFIKGLSSGIKLPVKEAMRLTSNAVVDRFSPDIEQNLKGFEGALDDDSIGTDSDNLLSISNSKKGKPMANNEDYGFNKWLQGRARFEALADREGILRPMGFEKPKGVIDPNDFTDRYNTQLTPKEESLFQDWLKNNGVHTANELYNYDLRGAWKNGDVFKLDSRGHLTDRYKKPNHPTFSNQSMYDGVDGFVGGHWSNLGKESDNRFVFTPGRTNKFSKEALNQYVLREEAPRYGSGFNGVTLLDNRAGDYYNDNLPDGFTAHLESTPNSNSSYGLLNPIVNLARKLSGKPQPTTNNFTVGGIRG